MRSSENGGPNKQDTRREVHEEGDIYEDETNPIDMDFFRVLCKHKWSIFLVSVLPTLVVGLGIFLLPKDYKISFAYNMKLDEKAFKILADTFYSTENLEKLVGKLQEDGLDRYAKKLAGTTEDVKEFVSFEISPSYFEATEPSKAKSLDELQKFQQVKGSILVMHVGAKSEENIRAISSVYRKNFEQIIPLYSVKEELNTEIMNLKEKMAIIEETRYTLDLQLERGKSTLEKLKNSGSESLGKLPSNIVLQFNIEPSKVKGPNELQNSRSVGNDSAYLPLPYQVQAAETQIINLEEQIRANKEMYSYYADSLNLNEKLFGYVNKALSSYCTLEQFHLFLSNTLEEYKNNQEISDYLKAYIKRIENKITNSMPLVERPKVYSVAKGTVRKTATVFMIALVISIFVAFLREGGGKKSNSGFLEAKS